MIAIKDTNSMDKVIGGWGRHDKAEFAAELMRTLHGVRLREDGIVVCKDCGGERMFHLTDYGKNCWLPIICRCKQDKLEQ